MTRCPHPTLISRMSHLYICILLFFYCYLIIHGVAELQNFSYINKKYGWTFGLVYIYSDLIFRGIYLHHWMIYVDFYRTSSCITCFRGNHSELLLEFIEIIPIFRIWSTP